MNSIYCESMCICCCSSIS